MSRIRRHYAVKLKPKKRVTSTPCDAAAYMGRQSWARIGIIASFSFTKNVEHLDSCPALTPGEQKNNCHKMNERIKISDKKLFCFSLSGVEFNTKCWLLFFSVGIFFASTKTRPNNTTKRNNNSNK